jgi:small nuclear ribonucleoprotein (snRNP)-like protein
MKALDVKEFQDKTVVMELESGEVLTAKILMVDVEYEDVVVDVIRTNRPELNLKSDAVYAIALAQMITIRQSD